MTDAELAILSIISEAPIKGTAIQQVIAERNLRHWTLIGVESVYYVVEKLRQQGLVASLDDPPPQDPQTRRYRITSAGIGILQTAITDLLSTPHHLPDSFDLGLANLNVLKPAQIEKALADYRANLQNRHVKLREQLEILQGQQGENLPFHIRSLFEHQLMSLAAEMAWFDEWIESWRAQADFTEKPPPTKEISPAPRMQQVVLPHDPDSVHKLKTRPTPKAGESSGIEFPPPPQKRPSPPQTQVSQRTPPAHIDPIKKPLDKPNKDERE